MIPLFKLSKLPRSQKLRKAANLVRNAERRYALTGGLDDIERDYLVRLLKLLANDGGFPAPALDALKNAEAELTGNGNGIRRALNTAYQLILTETGRFQADWDFYESGGSLDSTKRRPFPGMYVYLEDIRSPHNVGAMFRAAESFGAEKIWLSPLCADPRHKRAERTAMGCVDVLPWERLEENTFNSAPAPAPFFALETGGTPLGDFPFPERGILIAGSEELGVSPEALAVADASLGRVSIPTFGAKGSLNVSVAFGIVMQAWAAKLSCTKKQDNSRIGHVRQLLRKEMTEKGTFEVIAESGDGWEAYVKERYAKS